MSFDNSIMQFVGHKWGPPQCRHWSELSELDQLAVVMACPILRNMHDDYPIDALKKLPRTLTAFFGQQGSVVAGNAIDTKPIPPPGRWLLQKYFFALKTPDNLLISWGFRYDDVESAKLRAAGINLDLFTFPRFTIKQYPHEV